MSEETIIKLNTNGKFHSLDFVRYLQSIVDEINVGFNSYHANLDRSGKIPQIRIGERE